MAAFFPTTIGASVDYYCTHSMLAFMSHNVGGELKVGISTHTSPHCPVYMQRWFIVRCMYIAPTQNR